jgi:hypothetical protein
MAQWNNDDLNENVDIMRSIQCNVVRGNRHIRTDKKTQQH